MDSYEKIGRFVERAALGIVGTIAVVVAALGVYLVAVEGLVMVALVMCLPNVVAAGVGVVLIVRSRPNLPRRPASTPATR